MKISFSFVKFRLAYMEKVYNVKYIDGLVEELLVQYMYTQSMKESIGKKKYVLYFETLFLPRKALD